MLSIYLLYFLCLQKIFCSNQDDLPEIETKLGRVRGLWKTTVNGRLYAAFEGIPYANPPVGDLRFEEPQPINAWSGIWEANNPQTCLQAELITTSPTRSIFGHEDCLYLNVYVPAEILTEPQNLDVIVSIHGGAFMIGSGHAFSNSKFMMDRNIVLVSINYRLGILGFLSTEDDVIPGNNGMKDQVLALQWVRDNIAAFGGNPDSVTIIGLSAGGASVHLHYFSSLSKGLFVRGMSQSGAALAPWAIRRNALQRAKKLAVLVGCPDSPTKDLKACLKQRPAENLLQQLKHFFGFASFLPFSPFAPVVEKGSRDAFLEKEPFQLLKEGNVLDVPWITSIAAEDGLFPAGFFVANLDQIDQQWTQASKYILDYNDTIPLPKKDMVPKEILDFYLGSGENINKENFMKFTRMSTDRLFGIPAEVAAKMQSIVNKSPVYFYIFNYREGELSAGTSYQSQNERGVAHGDDGIYFYGIFAEGISSEKDIQMINACQDVLYSFASKGKPSFDGTNIWQPTTPEELVYLNVTGADNIQLQRIKNLTPSYFWNTLGLLENDNIIIKDEL